MQWLIDAFETMCARTWGAISEGFRILFRFLESFNRFLLVYAVAAIWAIYSYFKAFWRVMGQANEVYNEAKAYAAYGNPDYVGGWMESHMQLLDGIAWVNWLVPVDFLLWAFTTFLLWSFLVWAYKLLKSWLWGSA